MSFFLSYAHSAPLTDAGRRDTDTDYWVRRCFNDLSQEVARLLSTDPGRVGFVDYLVEPGADWKAMLTDSLGRAEVFVPLYSPGYFNKSWPLRERATFLDRIARAFADRPDRARAHVVPVLWIPLPSWDKIPELNAALTLGAGIPEYAENGLRALCMLASYREQYRRVLNRLAHRIVEVTERSELPPGEVTPLNEIALPDQMTNETPFVVGVIAERPGGVGERSGWRPFGAAQDPPVAEYVANVAERLGLPTRIIDRPPDLKAVDNSPAVILVDPRAVDRDDALGELRGHLHPWVTTVVVTDRHEPRYPQGGAEAAGRAVTRLTALGAHRVHQAFEVEELADMMPSAVSEARRQYLRRESVHVPGGSPRPRLGDGDPPPAPGKGTDV
ncbi:hypothetical protein GCM10010435_90670 [Winogradskya consettensis]|uniref:TIR domain-containing protein n=1 Tax=Winogradskya consettensis TaxID=113560 RepID=A0A919SWJ8_9ACTN|nr:TIR-like protein FxsC [Actinoplanes consettensis]GIM79981.1 hypothetical protein Aco04nite_68300 [Actinoplanes consettensis]